MKGKRQRWFWLLMGLALVVFLILTSTAPGWGMDNQSQERQTVPELTPRAYLPLVVRNFGGAQSSGIGGFYER